MREYLFVFVKIDYDDIDVFVDDMKEYLNECDEFFFYFFLRR